MTTPSFMSVAGLDLFRALVVGGPLTTGELAERTGFEERCVREWLGGQVDRGYVTYDSTAEVFLLTPEQAARLDGSPALHAGQGLRQRTTSDQEVDRMVGMQVKSFESPDEVRPFEGNGKADVLEIGGRVVGRTTLEPGWKWSHNVKPIAGTDSCQVSHLGYCLSGRMKVHHGQQRERDQLRRCRGDCTRTRRRSRRPRAVCLHRLRGVRRVRQAPLGGLLDPDVLRLRRYAGAASRAATADSWRKDSPITAF